ncbi:hypothetical protein DFH06DRAFT_981111, partial [Mycena polygramma]
WTLLEEAYGFQSSSAAIGAKITKPGVRPSEVGQWIKHGWSTTRETEVKDQETLVTKWWDWWKVLSPAWRNVDDAGRPAAGDVAGDWGVLVHPGVNGMLAVMLPLVWWRLGEEGAPSKDWLAAVHDVAFVLKGLLSAAKEVPLWVPFFSHDDKC